MATYYVIPGTTNLNNTGEYSATSGGAAIGGGSAPTSADTLVFNASSGPTRTLQSGSAIQIASIIANNCNPMTLQMNAVSLDVLGNVDISALGSINVLRMNGGSAGTLSLGNCTVADLQIAKTGGAAVTLSANTNIANTSIVTIAIGGNFNSNGWQMACARITINGTLNMASSIWGLNGSGNIWVAAAGAGSSVNSGTSTILVRNYSETNKLFYGGGKAYYNMVHQADYSILQIRDANTFQNYTASPFSVTEFQAGITHATNGFGFNCSAQLAKTTIRSTVPGAAAILSGPVPGGYRHCNISDISMSSGAVSAYNSTNLGNCSNIIFRPTQNKFLNVF